MKIARLTGCENFVDEREHFIVNEFVDLILYIANGEI